MHISGGKIPRCNGSVRWCACNSVRIAVEIFRQLQSQLEGKRRSRVNALPPRHGPPGTPTTNQEKSEHDVYGAVKHSNEESSNDNNWRHGATTNTTDGLTNDAVKTAQWRWRPPKPARLGAAANPTLNLAFRPRGWHESPLTMKLPRCYAKPVRNRYFTRTCP